VALFVALFSAVPLAAIRYGSEVEFHFSFSPFPLKNKNGPTKRFHV
jgi:hypothetical protein